MSELNVPKGEWQDVDGHSVHPASLNRQIELLTKLRDLLRAQQTENQHQQENIRLQIAQMHKGGS
jgi:hypothetical protein